MVKDDRVEKGTYSYNFFTIVFLRARSHYPEEFGLYSITQQKRSSTSKFERTSTQNLVFFRADADSSFFRFTTIIYRRKNDDALFQKI